jgi:hypothetical protein
VTAKGSPRREGEQREPRDNATGYDIYGCGASIEAPMGTFERIRRQGYDWFGLIGASHADGDGSGTGEMLKVPKRRMTHGGDKTRARR